MSRISLLLVVIVATLFGQDLPPVFDESRILDIRRLLDICPANDPAIGQIQTDFEIRRDGQPAPAPACTEPASDMPLSGITNELLWWQILRVAYYMDRGRTNYLPWTSLRFYDWVKSKIGGINIANLGAVAGSCCLTIAGKRFMNANLSDDLNKSLGIRPQGALSRLGLLLGHEARHVDGFPHVSCCPRGSCDQTYDESNLSAFGVGMWMARALFIEDRIPTGLECDYAGDALTARAGLYQTYSTSGALFCDVKPPAAPPPPMPEFSKCPTRQLALAEGAVTNAANYAAGSLSNGEILTIFSASIDATQTTGAKSGADGRLVTTLDQTRLVVNGLPAPLIYVAPGQLSGIVPGYLWMVTTVNGRPVVTVEFSRNGLLSQPVFISLSAVNPGIFTTGGSGSGPAAALNEDNGLNTAENAAAKGSIVQLFATGTGRFAGATEPGRFNQ